MKFRQRQILLSVGLFCSAVFFFLHSKTPDSTEQLLQASHRDAGLPLSPRPATLAKDEAETDRGREGAGAGAPPHPAPVRGKGRGVEGPGRAAAEAVVYVNQSSASDCPQLLRPDRVEERQVFQKVDGSSALLEFSAFLDRQQKVVRVVGLSVTQVPSSIWCLLWYQPGQEGGKELRVARAKLSRLPENHGRKYSAHYIECALPEAATDPYAVSVTSRDCQQARKDVRERPSNVIPILKAPEELRHNFTLCVTALNYRYSRAYELVEMIELNRLLGAQRFTFYLHSVGDNVARVLHWYRQQGLVQLVDWNLPMQVDHWPPAKQRVGSVGSGPEVHYFAQLASHNDCLNRHRGVSRYLVYQDLDEFIIPKQNRTWAQLLSSLKVQSSGYTFRCVFFRKDWPANSDNFTGRATADKLRSVVLATDKREPNFFPFGQRAKYIVDPYRVQTVGIHNVWSYRGGLGRMTPVAPALALLHHYRSWENPADAARAVRDTDMYRFKEPLLQALQERWAQLPQVPLDIPLSHYGQV